MLYLVHEALHGKSKQATLIDWKQAAACICDSAMEIAEAPFDGCCFDGSKYRSLTANLENAGNTDLSQPPATCCIISVADDVGLVFTQRLEMGSSHGRDETSS
jgi:hypothetical protein